MGAYHGRYERFQIKQYTWLLVVGSALLLALTIYLLGTIYSAGEQMQMPFGWGTAVVMSNSMKPTFEKGDMLIVRELDGQPEIGEIVIYQHDESLVVHRVIAYENGMVTTKGDANSGIDPEFSEDKIQALVVYVVPFVGTAIQAVQTPWGVLALVLLLLGVRVLPGYLDRRTVKKTKLEIQHDIRYMREETSRILKQTEVRKK